jgi:hypothetical protein
MFQLLQLRGQPELLESIELVIAWGTVRTHTDRYARPTDFHDIRNSRTELQIRARAVDHTKPARLHGVEMFLGQPHSMRNSEVIRQDPHLIEILDLISTRLQGLDDPGLLLLLQSVGVDGPTPITRDRLDAAPQIIGATQNESGIEKILQSPTRSSIESLS